LGQRKANPLGCVLAHWKELGGVPGGNMKKSTLIKYCNQWWPLYKLDDGEKWPENGSLRYNTLLQLMLFLRRENKWDETAYADCFFTFYPEWQKQCGINLAPQDSMVLLLEKEAKGKNCMKRCCSSCSIGQRCLKLKAERDQDPLETQELMRCSGEDSGDERTSETGPGISSRTRSKAPVEKKLIAPLRQVVGPDGGITKVKTPFTALDLDTWREAARMYSKDPEKVAKRFELVVRNQDVDWEDIDLMLSELTETEKAAVVSTARTHVQGQIAAGTLHGNVDNIFPTGDTHWDPNDPQTYPFLVRYRKLQQKHGVPKALNWSKLYEVKQNYDESPPDFLNRLREAAIKYTNLDSDSAEGKTHQVLLFMGQAPNDIRRKLQKLDGIQDISKLLEVAWKVYRDRDPSDRIRHRPSERVSQEKPPKRTSFPMDKDTCVYCKKKRHWKSHCPMLKKKPPVPQLPLEQNSYSE
uniref:Core shell protein Gag P30 domain-containing protein n=1 Tax=Corvus moneduloides TaxID=1196302 RepID=A0A8U7P0N4_CORMO